MAPLHRLKTDSSEHGQVIHTQQIIELPLNGRKLLGPRAAFDQCPSLSDHHLHHGRAKARFNVNGLRSTYNNFSSGRPGQQRLLHQQPGIFQPGGAAFARCDRRIQSDPRQLQRRIRTRSAARW